MENGCLAVALVQKQVVVVQATREHAAGDPLLDVCVFLPFGDRTFLASSVPQARISPADLLAIFPSSDVVKRPEQGMLELPLQAFTEFMELSARMQEKYERLYDAWSARSARTG